MSKTFLCTTNTPEIKMKVLSFANRDLSGEGRLQADFEHGQWYVTDVDSGAQWSVNDAEDKNGKFFFFFEQITEGDEE